MEEILIKAGVQSIVKEYGPAAEVAAIMFRIDLNGRAITVRLPADKARCQDALWKDYVGKDRVSHDGQYVLNHRKPKRRAAFAEQAERTAWKLVLDWVEVQISMIALQQAEITQVFLPYIWDESRRVTFFDQVKAERFAALPAPEAVPA